MEGVSVKILVGNLYCYRIVEKIKQLLWVFLFVLSLILVCIPRFNREGVGVSQFTTVNKMASTTLGDSQQYILLTQHYRYNNLGDNGLNKLRAPFAYRFLVPFIASFLPFTAMTSINLVNIVSLLIGLLLLYRILVFLALEKKYRLLGSLLYIFSFPMFYYGTTGYVNPGLIACIMFGTYCILKCRWISLTIAIILGALVKETIIILLPVLMVQLLLKNIEWKKRILIFSSMVIFYALTIYLVRKLTPVSSTYIWIPSYETLLSNLLRPRAWLSFALSFGIPGLLCLRIFSYIKYEKIKETIINFGPLIVGALGSLAIFLYAMISAYADGRFIWTSYPFTIPMAMMLLQYFKDRRLPIKKNTKPTHTQLQ